MLQLLGFVGITDVQIIAADQQMVDGEAIARATSVIADLKQAA